MHGFSAPSILKICLCLPVLLQLPELSGTCHSLCWHDATPGLPPLLLGGHDDGGSIWGYNSPSMMWKVSYDVR